MPHRIFQHVAVVEACDVFVGVPSAALGQSAEIRPPLKTFGAAELDFHLIRKRTISLPTFYGAVVHHKHRDRLGALRNRVGIQMEQRPD